MSSSKRSAQRCAPVSSVDQLRVDAHAVLIALHGAFENVTDAESLPISFASTLLPL